MNREILVSAVLRAESRREGAIDIDIVRRALAAQPAPVPKPVPVAWMEPCGTLMYISEVPNPERPTDTAVPLYLHSAAPVPVPLTDEQINAIWNAKDLPEHRSNLTPWGMDRIRAIIAASQDIAASPEVKP
jgi:hypothetical protein